MHKKNITPWPMRIFFHKSGKIRRWVIHLLIDNRELSSFARWLTIDKKSDSSLYRELKKYTGNDLPLASDCLFTTIQTSSIPTGVDILFYVAYCPSPHLSEIQTYQIDCYAKAGYAVIVIINLDNYNHHKRRLVDTLKIPQARAVYVRENKGFDFAAWSHAINILSDIDQSSSLTFTNDSIIPISEASIALCKSKIDQLPHDFIFMTQNNEHEKHGQSYFFAIKQNGIKKNATQIFKSIPCQATKDDVIHVEEIQLYRRLKKIGIDPYFLFNTQPHTKKKINTTIHHWKELIKIGFPFIKVQLFTTFKNDINDPFMIENLNSDLLSKLKEHVKIRTTTQGRAGHKS